MANHKTSEALWKSRALQNRTQLDYHRGRATRLAEENRYLKDRIEKLLADVPSIDKLTDTGLRAVIESQAQEIDRLRKIVDDHALRDAVDITHEPLEQEEIA